MNDLSARNALFERGVELGLNWTAGELADGTSTIYLPLREAQAMRASLYPFAHNWMLSWTTPLHGTEAIKVDKLNRTDAELFRALATAINLVIERCVDTEPHCALGIIGFLGALGIATENDDALAAATAGRARANAALAS